MHFSNASNRPKAFLKSLGIFLALILVIEVGICHWHFWLSLLGFDSSPWTSEFAVSKTRIVIIAVFYALFLVFRPSSAIWRIRLNQMNRIQIGLLGLCIITLCGGIAAFSQLSGQAAWLEQGAVYNPGIEAIQDGGQYNHLADALLAGRANLDLPVPDLLKEMDNPYDPAKRAELNTSQHAPIYWDYAYYDGSYYCYFGVVPCLLTFLPFKALTGMDLRTDYAVILFSWLSILSGILLIVQLQKNYFKTMSLGSALIGFMLIVFSCGVLEQAFLPRIYPIPILSALFFTYLGLSLWLIARRKFIEERRWCYPALVAGSFSLALTIGCRPQYVLAALLAFPIFYEQIKQREFFSKTGVVNTLAVMLPFVIVAAPIAYYNYVRFGSFTEFGAKYNLTGGDMTSYQFIPQKILVQILEYLFLPFQLTASFPFISTINESGLAQAHPYLQTAEPFYAGFMFLTPATFCIAGLTLKTIRTSLREKGLLGLCLVCLAIALFDIVVASYVSGTNMRYFADFAWLILIPATLVIWVTLESRQSSVFAFAVALLAIVGITAYCWTFLGTQRFGALYSECPSLFNALNNAFMSLL